MATAQNTHENLDRDDEVIGSSDRGFGLTFAAVFGLVGAYKLLGSGSGWGYAWFAGGAVFLTLALAVPGVLAPINRAWTRLGLLLYRVVNPVIMALLFYVTVVPIGLVMRLFGKRPLQLAREPDAASYWIERLPPGPPPATMSRQF